jgi:hypothetical protein
MFCQFIPNSAVAHIWVGRVDVLDFLGYVQVLLLTAANGMF